MSVRRSLFVLALVMSMFTYIVFSLNAQQIRQRQEQELERLNNLETYTVKRDRVESVVSALGAIEADHSVNVSFRVPGRIETVFVKEGDYVFEGEPLLQLENTSQQIALEQSLLARDRTEVEFANLVAPVSEETLTLAQAVVDSAWGQYLSIENSITDDDVRAAELSYQQALNAYTQLQERRDQAPGGYGSDAYINLDAQTGAASFNAEIARLRLEDLKTALSPQLNAAYARVILAQREYDRTAVGPSEFEIENAALRIRQTESQVRRAEENLNRTWLHAPIDGVVTFISVEQGSLIVPGITVAEIIDLSPLRLTVAVDEIDVRFVREGMEARIELDALPDVSIPAWVKSIALTWNSDGGVMSYDVALTVDETFDPRIRIGMTAEASIIVDMRENVLVIPNYYIRRNGERSFVNVFDDGELVETEITLGLQSSDVSEVLSGIDENTIVAIDFSEDRFSLFGE